MSKVNLKQLVRSGLRESDVKGLLRQDNYSYKSIFLNRVKPDPTNARYFPATIISDLHASQFARRFLTKRELMDLYDGKGRVLVGKKCFVNCETRGTKAWQLIEKNIDNIMNLALNIERSEVIQAPTIYPDLETEDYILVTGHRRFFAMIYCNGADGVAQFKVYDSAPLLKKTKQFQENASREDLPQYGKLLSFISAKEEVEVVSQAAAESGGKKLTVREVVSILGISSGAYDNYNVLTRYPSVVSAYEGGLIKPFVSMKKLILDTEIQYKAENNLKDIGAGSRRSINIKLKSILNGESIQPAKPKSIKLKPITSKQTIKTLLTSNIMALDTGIDWDALDWSDIDQVNQNLAHLIDYLEGESVEKTED